MVKSKIIEEQKISFDGNLLINTRTINRTSNIYQRIEQRSRKNSTVSVSEFSELLVLLESISTSGKLYYDGTVPSIDTGSIRRVEESIESKAGVGNLFDIAEPSSDEELLLMCRAGVEQAIPLLLNRIKEFSESPEQLNKSLSDIKPLANADFEKIKRFSELVTHSDIPDNEKSEFCKSVMRENFNGSKCVAGILALPNIEEPYAKFKKQCRSLVSQHENDGEKMRLIIPMFINSFRANFLNTLANNSGNAAFFSGPDTEHVLDCQTPLLASYFAKRMGEDLWAKLSQGTPIEERMQSRVNFPFIGLLTFLDSNPNEPYSVFNGALQDKDPIRAEFLAKKGGQWRFIHSMNASELEEFTNKKLDSVYSSMRRRYNFYDRVMRVNSRYLQPTLSAYIAKQPSIDCARLLLTSLGCAVPDELSESLPAHALEATDYTLNQVITPGAHINNACFTQRINKRLQKISEDPELGKIISKKVEQVFGLELAKD